MEIYPISDTVQEATAYGNAVIVDDDTQKIEEKPKVNLEAYIPKAKAPVGKIYDLGGYKFVVCPKCGTKYKTESDENG